MILAREDGRLRVVLHAAHQEQAGLIAAAWGNDSVGMPEPRDHVVAAVATHDSGWRSWDEAPALDPRTGQPLQFLEVGVALVRLHAAGVKAATALHPYVGLLMSMHVCGVLGDRYGWDRGKTGSARPPRPAAALAFAAARWRFLTGQSAHRRALRRRLAGEPQSAAWLVPRALWHAYDLLQVCDELALHFAMARSDERTIGPPPARGPGATTLPAVALRTAGPRAATLAPYPFAAERVELPLAAAYAEDRPYADTAEFAAALAEAPRETLVFSLSPGERPEA